jgi:hypothetical protein
MITDGAVILNWGVVCEDKDLSLFLQKLRTEKWPFIVNVNQSWGSAKSGFF